MPGQNGDDAMIEQLWAIWRRRRWVASFLFFASLAAAVSLIASLPNLYGATATVLVNQDRLPGPAARPADVNELATRLDSVSQEVMSRARLQWVIERFNLYPKLRTRTTMEDVVERMRQDIYFKRQEVEPQWGGNPTIAFSLSYRYWDPQTAAR